MPQSDYLGVNEQYECLYAQKMSEQAFMCFVKTLRFTPLPAIYQITKSIGYKRLKPMFYQQYKMMNSYFRKAAIFLVYVMLLYCCYITSGIYHEKLLKYRYKRSLDQTLENFQAPIIFTLFPSLVSTMIGFVILKISNKNSEEDLHIPMQKSLVASAVINLNMWTYNQAVLSSSFAAAVMVKSCSLLSVILVGVFFSRVKDTQLKLGANKIWIGLMASLGIVLFNYFKITQQDNDRPLNVVGILFLLVSLVGDGILPDLQAQIKSQYKPSAIQMYYSINRSTFIIAIIYAVVSFQLLYIFDFLGSHEEVMMDIFLFSVLNSLGQLVVYQMIKLFKQHIPAFVIATRKCLTVIANLLYFHHQVNRLQVFGIGFVFMAVMMEVYANYQEKMQKEAKDQESSVTQMDSQIKYLSNNSKQECEKATIASNNPTE